MEYSRQLILLVQEVLKVPQTGVYSKPTVDAVIRFQMQHNLVADGILGPKTLESMHLLDSDLRLNSISKPTISLIIHNRFLPDKECFNLVGKNEYIFLHHTAGWNDPFKTADDWERDDRGAIGTEFVIGGKNCKTGDDTFDGTIVKALRDGKQGWHLGPTGSEYMNKHSVGIELCNFGQLNKEQRTYVNTMVQSEQVCKLSKEFRGYLFWHRYSDNQLLSLKQTIRYVADRDSIDIRKGIIENINKNGVEKAFEFSELAYSGQVKGLLLHTNVRKDKFDLFPQPELIDMLLSL